MKRLVPLLLFFALGSLLTVGCYRFQFASAAADTLSDAGVSGAAASAAPAERPSDKVDGFNTPAAAWSDAKAARKVGWPLLVFAILIISTRGIASGKGKLERVPLLGRLATWLSTGRSAMIVAAVGTFGAAAYDVTIGGGSLVAALFAGGVAAAGLLSPAAATS